ncbi:MAG: hypothetical protein AAF560_21470 [Acidobacteriota bacterium]
MSRSLPEIWRSGLVALVLLALVLLTTGTALAQPAAEPAPPATEPSAVTEPEPAEPRPAETEAAEPRSAEPRPEAASSQPRPGVATFKVELSPTEITVGDRVDAELTVVWMGPEPTSEPRFPTWQETWGKAEVLETGEVESFVDQSGRRIYRQGVTLTAFETGDFALPKVTVAVPLDDETVELTPEDPASFVVQSVLPEEEGEGLEPRDAAPLRALSPDQRFWWTVGVLAALTLGLAWQLWRRLGIALPGLTLRPLAPPLEELLEKLRQLDPAAPEPAHTGISHTLRNFLGRRLAVPAVESTTSEIQRLLRQSDIPPTIAQGAVRLLQECDQVKFARLEVTEAITDDRLLKARELAREIEDALRPPEPVAEAEA